jgi:heme-degrading monooxygenase HmoA
MPHIQTDNQPVTQITVIQPEPGKQAEALALMTERARFMARQPGFISVSLHRSLDGRRIVNYIQWQSRDLLRSAHKSPEFRKEWDHFDQLTDEIDPHLYEVAHIGLRQPELANLSHGGHERAHRRRVRRNRVSRPPRRSASPQTWIFCSDCIEAPASG